MLEIYNNDLPVNDIITRWYDELKIKNYGADVWFRMLLIFAYSGGTGWDSWFYFLLAT